MIELYLVDGKMYLQISLEIRIVSWYASITEHLLQETDKGVLGYCLEEIRRNS